MATAAAKTTKEQASWIWSELEEIERSKSEGDNAMIGRNYDSPKIDNGSVQEAVHAIMELNQESIVQENLVQIRKSEECAKVVEACKTCEDLRTLVETLGVQWNIETEKYWVNKRLNSISATEFYEVKLLRKNREPWMETITLASNVTEDKLQDAKDVIVNRMKFAIGIRSKFIETKQGGDTLSIWGFPMMWPSSLYMAACSLLSSPCVFSANLESLDDISRMINKVAKIDRLPSSNSPEELEVLKMSWDNVDIFNHTASHYKIVAKAAYLLLILIAALVILTITGSCNAPEFIDEEQSKYIILTLSLLSSFVGAVITYLDPSAKWQQLRAAALELEGEIWKFRTRTGPYSISNRAGASYDESSTCEEHLRLVCEALNSHVLQSASVIESTFFAKFNYHNSNMKKRNMNIFGHGQYRNAGVQGTFKTSNPDKDYQDDHQSPLKPNDYLELRAVKQLQFYQGRVPIYYRVRTIAEIILILGGLAGTVLAFFDLAAWAGVTAAITFMVTSWLEFAGTSQKLRRYSDTIHRIGLSIGWWRSLTEVDRSNQLHIDNLVDELESLFQTERQSWVSTNMSAKMLSKQVSASKGSNEAAGNAQGNSQTPSEYGVKNSV